MKNITINYLQKAIKEIDTLPMGNSQKADRYFMKLIEEVGALSEVISKDKRMKNNEIKNTVEEELYDVLYYVMCLANTYNIDLENSITLKENLNAEKYKRKSICEE